MSDGAWAGILSVVLAHFILLSVLLIRRAINRRKSKKRKAIGQDLYDCSAAFMGEPYSTSADRENTGHIALSHDGMIPADIFEKLGGPGWGSKGHVAIQKNPDGSLGETWIYRPGQPAEQYEDFAAAFQWMADHGEIDGIKPLDDEVVWEPWTRHEGLWDHTIPMPTLDEVMAVPGANMFDFGPRVPWAVSVDDEQVEVTERSSFETGTFSIMGTDGEMSVPIPYDASIEEIKRLTIPWHHDWRNVLDLAHHLRLDRWWDGAHGADALFVLLEKPEKFQREWDAMQEGR